MKINFDVKIITVTFAIQQITRLEFLSKIVKAIFLS